MDMDQIRQEVTGRPPNVLRLFLIIFGTSLLCYGYTLWGHYLNGGFDGLG